MRWLGLLLAAGIAMGAGTPPAAPPTPTPLQPPPPSGGVVQDPPQTPPGEKQQATNPDQRGTQDSPLFVKVVPPPQSEREPAQRPDQEGDKSSPDWWLVKLTGGLIGVGLLQAWVFWVQAGRLRETIDYQFPFAEGHHQTWFAYDVMRRAADGRSRLIQRSEGDIPAGELMLTEPFFSEKYAD